jgi:hypothetical protein
MKIQKYISLLTIILSLSLHVAFAQDNTKNFDITGFDELEISGSVNVHLEQGSSESIRVETINYEMKDVGIEKSGRNTLKVYIKKHKKMKKNRKVVVYITCVNLKKLKIDGASDIFAQKTTIRSDKLELETKGASDLEMKIEVGELKVKTSGAANIEISGKADKQTIASSGASHFRAGALKGKEVTVKSSGASNVSVQVSERFKAKASGASNIRYEGDPKKSSIISLGASNVSKKE